MKKRPKPTKRRREKVEPTVHRDRLRAGRVFRVHPNPDEPFVVEVRIAPDARRMRGLMHFHDGAKLAREIGRDTAGLVRTWYGPRTRRAGVLRHGRIVARMYLNVRDLQHRPSEIVSHEATHAAMGYARFKRANLSVMPGEEVMAYAVGRLTAQINRVCYAAKAFR